MKCANCSGEHAANWSRCPKHPNNSKQKNKNGPKPKNHQNNNNKKSTPQAPTITPAPSKDASINAGLLKDLLMIIEDTPFIDKQVFCRAFKNSLSALRTASADVDKTYIIFEAYCRLRHSQA
ncbi:hypothetical protein TNCV_4266991 [Trichonephila clavipes]|nr:hypothetical protein TNCV_4266991 [Trichonephila clavipes]